MWRQGSLSGGQIDPTMPFRPQVEQWRSLLSRYGGDLPVEFLLAWLEKESGGSPCATGIPNVEAGIFQTFHPSDDRFGATFEQLRAACSGQSQVRQLSSEETELQARAGINFVRGKRDAARAHFAAAGIRFGAGSTDFWTGVKQEHALPCVMGGLLPRITAKLGRPPRSWAEIHQTAMAMAPSEMDPGCAKFAASPSLRGLRNRLEDTFANAEEIGRFGSGGVGSVLLKIALAAGLAFVAYKIWTAGDSPAALPPPAP